MRNFTIISVITLLFAVACFVQVVAAEEAVAQKTMFGKVLTVNTVGTIEITNDDGIASAFTTDKSTKIYSQDLNAISLSKIQKGARVSIKYTESANMVKKAISITIIEN